MEEIESRTQRLHRESFIWDYFPFGESLLLTPRLEQLMQQQLADGKPAFTVLERMIEERIIEFERDQSIKQAMREFWQHAGVGGACITLLALDSLPGETEPLMRTLAQWHRRIDAGGYMALVTGATSIRNAWQSGKVGIMLGMQDTTMLPRDVDVLDTLYSLGVRVIQLTYNLRNLIGDGCTERTQAGLSRFGVEFVQKMNRVGIVVDVSHCGRQTTIDAIELSEKPVAVTHAFCRALRDHPRGKTDEELELLAKRDGYLGIAAVPHFLSDEPSASLAVFLDHVDYAVKLIGADRVGVCTDWGGWSPDLPESLRPGIRQLSLRRGFRPQDGMTLAARPGGIYFREMKEYTEWIAITRGLVSRGYSDEEIQGLLGQNWLRFLERAGLS